MFKPSDNVLAFTNANDVCTGVVTAVGLTSGGLSGNTGQKIYYKVQRTDTAVVPGDSFWASSDVVFKQLSNEDIAAFQHPVPPLE